MSRRAGHRGLLAAAVAASAVLAQGPERRAHAFTIASAFSDPCHEQATFEAFRRERPIPPGTQPPGTPDQDATWIEIAHYLEDDLGLRFSSDVDRMVLVSALIGVRFPDQKGFAIVDLENIREIHLAEQGQEDHALRHMDQDGDEGSPAAVDETRAHILEVLGRAYEDYRLPTVSEQTAFVPFFLDFYGAVDVRVWRPAFRVGVALHALQDSFPHTYRSPDARRVYAVGNYIDALRGPFDERRDGPRHSDFLDACAKDEVRPLHESAIQASADLLAATRAYFETGDQAPIVAVLDDWLVVAPGCGYPDYCGTPWVALAKRDETQPPLACTAASPGERGPRSWAGALVLLGAAVLAALRRGRLVPNGCTYGVE